MKTILYIIAIAFIFSCSKKEDPAPANNDAQIASERQYLQSIRPVFNQMFYKTKWRLTGGDFYSESYRDRTTKRHSSAYVVSFSGIDTSGYAKKYTQLYQEERQYFLGHMTVMAYDSIFSRGYGGIYTDTITISYYTSTKYFQISARFNPVYFYPQQFYFNNIAIMYSVKFIPTAGYDSIATKVPSYDASLTFTGISF